MRVTLLVDNNARDSLRAEHGLSLLIETNTGAVVFDTGQSDAWLDNMRALGRDPQTIEAIALSHGHYDHAGGLAALSGTRQAPCHVHPAAMWPRYAIDARNARQIGIPGAALLAPSRFDYNREAREIHPGVTLSGEIPLADPAADPSAGRFFNDPEGHSPDIFPDEQCLILREAGETAVLVGCSHRGVENNVRAAMRVAGTDRLSLLLGGMHLGGAGEDRLDEVATYLEGVNIDRIVCCHCTGDRAFQHLAGRLGSRVARGRAGMSWTVGATDDIGNAHRGAGTD